MRVVYDGTHGDLTNFGINVRDHVRNPTAVDVKAWLAELARKPGPRFGIAYNVADAHRQVPTVASDLGPAGMSARRDSSRNQQEYVGGETCRYWCGKTETEKTTVITMNMKVVQHTIITTTRKTTRLKVYGNTQCT